MLSSQNELNFSPYAELYDRIIPKDNLLRRINENIDFSFIHEELKAKYCPDNGRMAEPPVRLFKYLLLKCINPLSDVDVVEHSRYDMSYKYFLGLNPEDDVIEPSTLTKFRKLRLEDKELLDMLINKTVEFALEKGLIKTKAIIMDATHTKSKYNSYPIREILQQHAKNLRKAVYHVDEKMKEKMPGKNTEDSIEKEIEYCNKLVETISSDEILREWPEVKERMNLLKETVEETKEELYVSADTDAKVGHKSADSAFFGYKTHIAMTPERLITAATVTSGEKPDGNELAALVEKSRKAGIEVEDVIADTAYSAKENIKLANKTDGDGRKNFNLVSKLNPVITMGNRKDSEVFMYNKDADMMQCRAGYLSYKKEKKQMGGNKNDRLLYYFDVEKCRNCPFKEGCHKEGAGTKIYSVVIKCGEHRDQEMYQKTDDFKVKAKERYKIEAKNSELKNVHGYDVAVGSGLADMKMQGACTIFVVNLKRIFTLMDQKQ